MESNPILLLGPELETFRAPEGTNLVSGAAAAANVASIVNVASHTFEFRENSNTPGRWLEQSTVVSVPSGAGFFVCLNHFMGAFTSPNFQFLVERPLGQFSVNVGLRGNNLVCQVRLTDSNSDDPVFVRVSAIVVFYR